LPALGSQKREQRKRSLLHRIVWKQRAGNLVFVRADDARPETLGARRLAAQAG